MTITMIRSLVTFLFIVIPLLAFSQPADTALASQYFQKALTLQRTARYDSAIYYFQKASELYLRSTTVGATACFLPSTRRHSQTERRIFLRMKPSGQTMLHVTGEWDGITC